MSQQKKTRQAAAKKAKQQLVSYQKPPLQIIGNKPQRTNIEKNFGPAPKRQQPVLLQSRTKTKAARKGS